MTVTLGELIQKLIDVVNENPTVNQDLPVYACHGASGVSDEIGSASVATVGKWDDGALTELEEGVEYVSLYTGN